jgi:hypothetical protein
VVTIRRIDWNIFFNRPFLILDYFIVELRVVFERRFDIRTDIRSNDIPKLLRGYVGIFLFDDEVQFLK